MNVINYGYLYLQGGSWFKPKRSSRFDIAELTSEQYQCDDGQYTNWLIVAHQKEAEDGSRGHHGGVRITNIHVE